MPSRRDELESLSILPAPDGPTHDVIVIGGGVNGTGVARDCAIRGLRVVLFEKNDLGFGASGNNSGMIHGGPRYLSSHPSVTEQSCRDSGYIQAIAPHLLFRIPFLFPLPARGLAGKVALAAVDAFFAFYDRYQPLKRGEPHTRLSPEELRHLEPGLAGDYVGAITFDEWGIDGARLCAANAIDAKERGAQIYVHHEVERILRHPPELGGAVRGIVARDTLTGQRVEATAKIVVNATGAWGPVTAMLAAGAQVKLRPGKGVHVVYDRRLSNYAVVSNAIDSRQIFVMPWENISWIGTTDDDFYGDLDHLEATTDEVRYLIQGVSRIFPAVRDARVIGTTAGVRPTLYAYGPNEDELSREHEIHDHGTVDGVRGLYSMLGGKLASYRLFAEEMSDRICKDLGVDRPSKTHLMPMPGGDAILSPKILVDEHAIPDVAARRLVYRHGTRAPQVFDATRGDTNPLEVVCPCEPVLACEVRHACRHEWARTLDDLSRRTRLGLGACGGMRCAHRAAQIVAEEHGYETREVHTMASDFVVERYRRRVAGMGEQQLRQEELLLGHFLMGCGLGNQRPPGSDE